MRKNYPPKSRDRQSERKACKATKEQYFRTSLGSSEGEEERDDYKTKALQQLYDVRHTDRLYKRLDKDQKDYFHCILKNPVTLIDVPAGTGKTTVAMMAGIDLLRRGEVDKLVYLRFPD